MSPGSAFEQFLAMGGYGGYVWPAYLIATATIVGLVVQTVQQKRRAAEKLASLEKGAPGA